MPAFQAGDGGSILPTRTTHIYLMADFLFGHETPQSQVAITASFIVPQEALQSPEWQERLQAVQDAIGALAGNAEVDFAVTETIASPLVPRAQELLFSDLGRVTVDAQDAIAPLLTRRTRSVLARAGHSSMMSIYAAGSLEVSDIRNVGESTLKELQAAFTYIDPRLALKETPTITDLVPLCGLNDIPSVVLSDEPGYDRSSLTSHSIQQILETSTAQLAKSVAPYRSELDSRALAKRLKEKAATYAEEFNTQKAIFISQTTKDES